MDRTSFGLPDPAADPPQGERRRSVRQKLHTPVYVSFNGPQTGLVVDLSELLDLNEDGFGVQTAVQGDDRLEANRVISLCLDLSETKSYVHGSGHVVWSDQTGRAGIRFSYLPDSAKLALKEWLFRNLLIASSNHASRVEQRAFHNEESHEPESPGQVLDVKEPINGRVIADVQSLAIGGEALASLAGAATPAVQQQSTLRSSISSLDVLRYEVRDLGDNPDAVIQRITTGALNLTGASGAALAFIADGVMICRARAGAPAPPIGAIVDTKVGLSGECVRTGRPVLCSDSENDARVDADLCRMLGLRSLLAVPIFADFRVAGLLEIFSPSPNAFTEAHEIILDRLVELVPQQPAMIVMRVADDAAAEKLVKPPDENKQTGKSISAQPDPLRSHPVSTMPSPTRDEGFTARNIREALRQQPSKVQAHAASAADAEVTKISQHSAGGDVESDRDLLSMEASRARKAQVILLGSVIAVVAVVFGYVLAPTIEKRWGGPHAQSAPTSAQAASSESATISSLSWPANHRAQDISLEDLRKWADQGVAEAQWRLGVLYHNGEGVPQSDAQAVEWFLRSANQGYVPAQATLGAYYWAGRGVPQDFSKAYFWSQLALAQGDENSKSRLEGLAAQMTHTQVTNARQQAEAWLQAHNQPLRSSN